MRKHAVTLTAALSLAIGTGIMPTTAHAASNQKPYVLVAAPRESASKGAYDYGPIAAFLSQALHHKVIYEHPNGWLTYERWLWKDHADIYFDGPQFVAWRLHHLQQALGPRIPQNQDFRLYTGKGSSVANLRQAANGAVLCAPPLPNFGTLWVTSLFTNPSRQPYSQDMHGWKAIYKAVVQGKCAIGIGPRLTIHYLDPNYKKITILERSPHYPNQAFTMSAKLSPAVQAAINQALLSPAGEKAMMRLRKRFAHGRRLVRGHIAQYKDADQSLDAQWGTIYAAGINRDLKKDAQREGLSAVKLMSP